MSNKKNRGEIEATKSFLTCNRSSGDEKKISLSLGVSLCVFQRWLNYEIENGSEGERLKKKKRKSDLVLDLCVGERRDQLWAEKFLFSSILRRRIRERESYFSFSFLFFVWVENRTSTKALFIIGLLRFCHLKAISLLLQILVIAVKLSFDCCRYFLRFCHFSLSLFFFSLWGHAIAMHV